MSGYVPLSNGSLPHSRPNQTQAYATYNASPPNVTSAFNRPGIDVGGFREEMYEMFKQTFGRDPRTTRKTYQKPYL